MKMIQPRAALMKKLRMIGMMLLVRRLLILMECIYMIKSNRRDKYISGIHLVEFIGAMILLG